MPPTTPPTHARQHSRNFSEVEFMDSGLGSLASDLPIFSLDNAQLDDKFLHDYLLSKLQDAQRNLQHIRDYKSLLGAPVAAAPLRRRHRLFVASFKLPLVVQLSDDKLTSSVSSGLGLTSAFNDLQTRFPIRWLGLPARVVSDERQSQLLQNHRKQIGLLSYIPLFPNPVDADAHQEFCQSVLWPLFHYIPLNFVGERVYHADMFHAYYRINRFYADALIAEYHNTNVEEPDAMFWIHDFHLFLVPQMLRDALPMARIGFFLHTPFPTGEVFRALATRNDLLNGLLGADLIGFHTYDYARHFLSVCERLLGLTTEPDAVHHNGVMVQVGIYPFGIDTDTFRNAMNQSRVQQLRDDLRHSFAGKKVIVGVDRLDYIKGIPHKLLAVQHFLECHPEWIGHFVMLQVTTPSLSASGEYHALRAEILELVGRINGRFATIEEMPIHYRECVMTFEELCALYAVADVAIITSLRDGMNLVSYEYIMCQRERNGVLILSEFTGAAQNLPGALLVNPWNIEEVSEAIYQSLEMPDYERELKHQKLYRHVAMHTSAAWGVSFVDDLIKYSTERKEKAKLLVEMRSADICDSYQRATGKRLFLLDYDGTLRKYECQPELAEPTEALLETLRKLTSSDQNIVFLVTGRQKATMAEWFHGVGVGFAVEHGFSLRWPDHLREHHRSHMPPLDLAEHPTTPSSPRDDTWDDLMSPHDLIAMKDALQIAGQLLRRIEDCTPTSFLSQKESAYSWHFRDADPDFAVSRAHDARQALEEVLSGSAMEVLMGQKILYVRPKGVDKGSAVAQIIEQLRGNGDMPTWIFSIGDDRTDEDMFSYLHEVQDDVVINTCTVGRKATSAKFYVQGVDDVLSILDMLSKC